MIGGLCATFAALSPPPEGEGRLLRGLRLTALRALVRVLIRRHHLADLLALLDAELGRRAAATASTGGGAAATDLRRVVDGLRGRGMTCLPRALAGYAALRARGEDVRLVVGVRPDDRARRDIVAHAWLERDGAPLGEAEDPRTRWAVAFVHPSPAAQEPTMASQTPPPDVILTELQDGTGVLLHLGTKFYYALNATGVAAWKLLDAGADPTPEEIALRLVEQFEGVTVDDARRDVETLLVELRAEDLLPRRRSA